MGSLVWKGTQILWYRYQTWVQFPLSVDFLGAMSTCGYFHLVGVVDQLWIIPFFNIFVC